MGSKKQQADAVFDTLLKKMEEEDKVAIYTQYKQEIADFLGFERVAGPVSALCSLFGAPHERYLVPNEKDPLNPDNRYFKRKSAGLTKEQIKVLKEMDKYSHGELKDMFFFESMHSKAKDHVKGEVKDAEKKWKKELKRREEEEGGGVEKKDPSWWERRKARRKEERKRKRREESVGMVASGGGEGDDREMSYVGDEEGREERENCWNRLTHRRRRPRQGGEGEGGRRREEDTTTGEGFFSIAYFIVRIVVRFLAFCTGFFMQFVAAGYITYLVVVYDKDVLCYRDESFEVYLAWIVVCAVVLLHSNKDISKYLSLKGLWVRCSKHKLAMGIDVAMDLLGSQYIHFLTLIFTLKFSRTSMEMFLNCLLLSWVSELDDIYVETAFPVKFHSGFVTRQVDPKYFGIIQILSIIVFFGITAVFIYGVVDLQGRVFDCDIDEPLP